MKKIIFTICIFGVMQNGFGKSVLHGSYHNYTQNISDSISSISSIYFFNVIESLADSVVLDAYIDDYGNNVYPQKWFFNSDSIPNTGGQQYLSVIINLAGTYTASFGSSELICFSVTNVTGIPSIKNINFLKVFPTTVTSSITIQLNTLKTNDIEISFFDMNGKELKNNFYKNIIGEFIKNENTETLAKGIYFLRIRTGEEVVERKFVKL
jgi:hypothetical protein